MFRRKGIIDTALLAFTLLAFSSAAFSAELGKRGKKEYMGACGEREAGMIYAMTNGSDTSSCDPSQAAGSERIYCTCTPDGEGGYSWATLFSALSDGATFTGALSVPQGTCPTSATDPGTPGDICFDSSYMYYCKASGSWGRVAIPAWEDQVE